MNRRAYLLIGLAMVALWPMTARPGEAQWKPASALPAQGHDAFAPLDPVLASPDSAPRHAGLPRLVAGGVLGGATGLVVGGLVGNVVIRVRGCEDIVPCLVPIFLSTALGESLLLPLGVHLANGRKGRYLPSALASVGIAAGGIALARQLDSGSQAGVLLVAVPVLQLSTSIVIETW